MTGSARSPRKATRRNPSASAQAATPTVMSRLKRGRGAVELVSDRIAGAGRIDGWLICIIAALCAFGLVMVYSASSPLGALDFANPNYFFERQLVCLVIGVIGMVVTMRFDYHRWQGLTRLLVLATLALMVFVLVPHLGASRNGARRWFVVGPISLQPSAVAALVAIIAFARWLNERGPAARTWRGVRDYGVLTAALLILILLEKDLGTSIVAGGVALALLALAGGKFRHLAILIGMALVGGWMLIQIEAYRAARVATFANPFADPLGTGFQPVQALFGLGSGGLTGVGLGNSIEKYSWLPEAHTDFIFAIVGEELGLLGTVSVIAAFLFLAWRGVRAAMRAPDNYGALLAGGITAWISIQAFINIAAVTNVIPTTGIPLPFISYGGTSLAMTLVAMGILCNVSAQGRQQGEMRRANVDRWGRDGRTLDTRARGRSGVASSRS